MVGELLEEVPSTLEYTQTAANARFEPEGIVEYRAVPAVFGRVKYLKKRLEEFGSDD